MSAMRHRPLGNTRFGVSEIGLGCWQLGGSDWGDLPDDRAFDILRSAADAGVNFFDTADVYGTGRSETLIGQFLKSYRKHRVYVATKLGRSPDPGWPQNFTPDAIRRHTEASLRRIGIESLDLTQLHCIPTEQLRAGHVFDALRAVQRDGLIRHWGVSVESMEEARICLEQEGLSCLQIIFNLFRQKPITELFDKARHKGVGLIVRLPLASGLLSGKMSKATHFAANDHRNYNRDGQAFNVGETFAGLPFEKGVELADAIKPLVPGGLTMAQMAMRWVLDHEAVSTVIPGASSPDQAKANAAVSDLPPLADELHERLRTFYLDRVAANIRGPY